MSSSDEVVIARVREALAEDSRTHTLDIRVDVTEDGIVLSGAVQSPERMAEAMQVARGAAPGHLGVTDHLELTRYGPHVHVEDPPSSIRVAAVGDVHVGKDTRGRLGPRLAPVGDEADLLLLAGDLTQHGDPLEGEVLARELAGLEIPVVAVLGNHDYHRDQQAAIRASLEAVGVEVLEGERAVIEVRGLRVVVAGAKGFGSGFAGACGTDFGEPEMKAFVQHAKAQAQRLWEAFASGDQGDVRIALTHYSPVPDTLEGEPPEIYPFLGSYYLGEVIDRARCHLAVHGHAHRGSERGVTPGGVPVRNVALPVIGEPYRVYPLGAPVARVA